MSQNVSAIGPTVPPPAPEEDERHDWSGTILMDRYKVVRRIGRGGMGDVYEGLHQLIGKTVAIKCLHPEFATNKQVVERFKREARAAALIGNEHIVEVMDLGDLPDGAPFLVMEFLQGQTLADLIEKGPMPIGRAVKIAMQVADALAATHDKDIVHRDLKPENIFLQARREGDFVKVLDFGISKIHEKGAVNDNLTRTGMTLGTPLYMSPEQAQGLKDLDNRADIWSLGVILHQMLTGELPFMAETYPMLLINIMTVTPPSVRIVRPDVPENLELLITRTLEKKKESRFTNMRQVSAALEGFQWIDGVPDVQVGMPRHEGAPTREVGAPKMTEPHGGAVAAAKPSEAQIAVAGRPGTFAGSDLQKKSTSKSVLMAAGAFIFLGTAVAAWALQRSHETPTVSAAPPVEPTREPPTVATPIAAPIQPAQNVVADPIAVPPTEVMIHINVTPSEGHIKIGDVEYPNPMNAMQPRSTTPIRIEISADGHQTLEQLVIFDREQTLSYTLARGRGVDRRSNSAGRDNSDTHNSESGQREHNNDSIYRGRQGGFNDNF